MLNKAELVRGIASEFGVPVREVDQVIDRFLELIGTSLAVGEDVKLSGFGKFAVKTLQPRMRRNPRTGEMFMAPEKKSVGFAASPLLKGRVAKTDG